MSEHPYKQAQRVFLVVDNGCAHRGKRSIDRLQGTWPNLIVVHTPIHASWLNGPAGSATHTTQLTDPQRAIYDATNIAPPARITALTPA